MPNVAAGSGKTHVDAIDGLRGIAVLWIVLGHCLSNGTTTFGALGSPLKYVFGGYFMGVDLLFVVSGFVLFLPAAMCDGSIGDGRNYAVRRAARIIPGFYLAITLAYLVARQVGLERGGIGAWIAHLLFLHQELLPVAHSGFGVDQPLWTMSVEVLFYCALPFVASRFYKRPLSGVAIAATITLGWQFATQHIQATVGTMPRSSLLAVQDGMSHSFPAYALHFALGMAGALVFVRASKAGVCRELRRLAAPATCASLVGLGAIAYFIGFRQAHSTAGPLGWQVGLPFRAMLFATMILAIAFASKAAQWPLTNPVSRGLGRFSYGIYLIHMPLIVLISRTYGLGPTSLQLAATVVLSSVFAGVISGLVVEEPIRRLARRTKRVPVVPTLRVTVASHSEMRRAAAAILAANVVVPASKAS